MMFSELVESGVDVVVTIAYKKRSGDWGYDTESISTYTEEELFGLCKKFPHKMVTQEEIIDIIIYCDEDEEV